MAGSTAFASVFPTSTLKPPSDYQRFEPQAQFISQQVHQLLFESSRVVLGINNEEFAYGKPRTSNHPFRSHYASCESMDGISEPTNEDIAYERSKYARMKIWSLAREWRKQLGGDRVRKIFAGIINKLITSFVNWAYAGVYGEDSQVMPHLAFWIKNVLAQYVVQFLQALQSSAEDGSRHQSPEITAADVQRWQEIAITRLGALRCDELFDIAVDWDATQSGIDDLKNFITNSATRTYLTTTFMNVLSVRLLHPGASTVEILRLYISIIRAFRRLDAKGVLLDRVARIIRRYLKDRDDTVKVIVAGLLSDPYDADGEPQHQDSEILTELAVELNQHDQNARDNDGELDWDNMDWVPDPIDAASDYLKSKSTDVLGSLITLFDTKDVFIKELQSVLADRLLRNKADFDQEIGVIEHLKIQFGDAALQGCEVMLRDVLDSRKVDQVIRRDQASQPHAVRETGTDVTLHAKILSRLFWPSLPDQSFKVPSEIIYQQSRYETGFEALKQSRKLTWLNAIGQVEVELDLEDRVFRDEVLPGQAAVIYAFQSSPDTTQPASRAVADLAEELEMSHTLVRSACIFWLSKSILAESAPDIYTVLETLNDSTAAAAGDGSSTLNTGASTSAPQIQPAAAAAAAEAAAAMAQKEVDAAEKLQKMAMYAQFVVAMLTNQGAMPLPRIAMMLGFVVPGGFPFSNEELKDFLAGMVQDGTLHLGHGGVYKIAT